jgi:FlaA1/EpsC-like NDP-sugar epimerase
MKQRTNNSSLNLLKESPFWRFLAKLLIDCSVLVLSILISFLLRFEGKIPESFLANLPFFASLEVLLLIAWEFIFATYRNLWRSTSFKDFFLVCVIITLQKISFSALTILLYPFYSYPRSTIISSWAFALIGMAGVRALRRYLYESKFKAKIEGKKNILIIGAGNAGRRIAQEITANPQLGYKIVGFLDDDPAKQGALILGYPVLGKLKDVKSVVLEEDVEEIIFAIPSQPSLIRDVFDEVREIPVRFSTLPSLSEIAPSKPLYQSAKELRIEDLLPRRSVKVNIGEIARFLSDKVVLVTGAGGSIGGELCKQLSSFPLKKLVLLGKGENSIFHLEQELRDKSPSFPIELVIGDIRDREKMEYVFQQHRPNIVFHTAAHKHVPLMELNPDEAITNNVQGTRILAEIAMKTGVEKFIYISTDKAVNPTSVMGAAKRVGEMLMRYYQGRSSTAFISVRFGNVLGSRGSVLEVFERQLNLGKPITITDPAMERYFMSIPEAVSLILKAGEMGKGGEVFVLDMGEQVKIIDLAKRYARLRGKILRDDDIIFVGRRPGEKLREELVEEGEQTSPTAHPLIININSYDDLGEDFIEKVDELYQIAFTRNPSLIKAKLKEIVRTYKGE